MAYSSKKKKNDRQNALRKQYQSKGLCSRCTSKAQRGFKLCRYHRAYARHYVTGPTKEQAEKWAARSRERVLLTKQAVMEHYGGKCLCCGESESKFLTIDHVNGDAAEDRKHNRGSGQRLWSYIKAQGYPDRYRLLCSNCNMAMGIYGNCPHGNLPPQSTNHPANPFRKRNYKTGRTAQIAKPVRKRRYIRGPRTTP